uniref:Uncharacterized protein n=1 Tax=Anguilla anguilla TaxID=7936 RepID=A0A0E9V313_ANGAN
MLLHLLYFKALNSQVLSEYLIKTSS